MSKEEAEGKFDQIKGKIREAGSKVTGDKSEEIKGKAEQFKGKVKEKIGEEKGKQET